MPVRSTILVSCTPMEEGVPEDDAEAVRWYRKAAEQGHAGAQYNLGEDSCTLHPFRLAKACPRMMPRP